LATARGNHTATLLSSGKVLVAGGQDEFANPFQSAEIYDPATGVWTPTGTWSPRTTSRRRRSSLRKGAGRRRTRPVR
jgi:hypothetical protein